jgi:hypothetical protein
MKNSQYTLAHQTLPEPQELYHVRNYKIRSTDTPRLVSIQSLPLGTFIVPPTLELPFPQGHLQDRRGFRTFVLCKDRIRSSAQSCPFSRIIFIRNVLTKPTGRNGWAPLHLACRNGHAEVVNWLLSAEISVDIHAKSKAGLTPLHEAYSTDPLEVVVKWLVAKSADVRTKSKYGGTPLHLACHDGHLSSS